MSKRILKIIFPVLIFCLFNLTFFVKPVYANNITPTDDEEMEEFIKNHIYIPVDDILINTKELTLPITTTDYELYVEVVPFDAIKSTLKWESSDTSVVKVDQEGKLTPIKKGTATVTATELTSKKSVSCKVKVVTHTSNSNKPSKNLEFFRNNLELEACTDLILRFKNTPSNIDLKDIKFYTDNKYTATISPLGVVEGTGVGLTTVYAADKDGNVLTSCKVRVIPRTCSPRYPNAGGEVRIGSDLYTVIGSSQSHKTVIYKKNTDTKAQFVTIPETISVVGMTYNVIGIDKNAFDNCPNIKEISIGDKILFKTNSTIKSESALKHAVHKALKQY